MKYFREIQKQKKEQTIVDAPVKVDELALLQDTVDKEVLGRIKFFNQSNKHIIAIFIKLYVYDISGETISFQDNQFIYQDMIFMPGDIYGNKIPIKLPLNTRKINIELIKVVFDDGEVWDANEAEKCETIYQKEIQIPTNNFEYIRRAIASKISNINYVKYYYEEKETVWSCTCGKINSNKTTYCNFCNNERAAEKENLSEVGFKRLCNYVNQRVMQEECRKKEIEKEKQYQEIISQMQRSCTEQEYRLTIDKFRQMKGYKDSEDKICQCQKKIDEILRKEKEKHLEEETRRRIKAARNRKFAIWGSGVVVISIAIILVVNFLIIPYVKYSNAKSLMTDGHYEEAITVFATLDDYKDSIDKINECQYLIKSEFLSQVTDNIVACTANASYALKTDGTVLATGNNEEGQLNVDEWSEIIGIDAADDYAVGIKKDGSVVATKEIQGLDEWKDIIDISAGNSYLAGLKSDGTVVTIGVSQYTIGETEDTDNWDDVIAISQGYDALVGLKKDGTVIGCGSNYYGQLEIDKWCNIIQIDTSDCFTAGLRSDGTVVCVGYANGTKCDTSKWSDIKEIAVDRWGIIGLKSNGSLVATGYGIDGHSHIIPYSDNTRFTGLSIEGMSEVSALDSDCNTICIKNDGTVTVVGPYDSKKQMEVSNWNDIVTVYPKNEAIDKIMQMEVRDIEVSSKKSQAEEHAEEQEKKEQARINEDAPIHIGMDSDSVLSELQKIVDKSEIVIEDSKEHDWTEYNFELSNSQVADIFGVKGVNSLPEVTKVELLFSATEGGLYLIHLYTKFPSNVSTEDSSRAAIEKIIKQEAQDMGAIGKISCRGQYGSYVIYRGTFEVDGVKIGISISEKMSDMIVSLYE